MLNAAEGETIRPNPRIPTISIANEIGILKAINARRRIIPRKPINSGLILTYLSYGFLDFNKVNKTKK